MFAFRTKGAPSCFLILLVLSAINSAASSEQYAEMGVCENIRTADQRCAMQASDCEPSHIDKEKNVNGETWYSAIRQKQRGFDVCTCDQTEVGACIGGDFSKAATTGEPVNISFRCAPHKRNCLRRAETFMALVDFPLGINGERCRCDILGDRNQDTSSPDVSQTEYGACRDTNDENKHFCAYSPDDCEYGHVWVEAQSVKSELGLDCKCENVRIGGCVGGFSSFGCAVTEDDCDFTTYFPPISLKEKHGESCRLCPPSNSPGNLVRSDEVDTVSKKSSSSSRSWIIILVGSLAGAAVLVFVIFFVTSSRRARKEEASEPNKTVVVESDEQQNDTAVEEVVDAESINKTRQIT